MFENFRLFWSKMNLYYLSYHGYNEKILVVPWSFVVTEFDCYLGHNKQ